MLNRVTGLKHKQGSLLMSNNLSRAIINIIFAAILVTVSALEVRSSERQIPQNSREIQLSFAPVVKESTPSVVNIYTKTTVQARRRMPLFDDPFFRRFFGDQFGNEFGGQRKRQQNSLGSGVIVDSSGMIVTNRHVVDGADQIRVVLHDRREFDASVVITDEKTDLAILKVNSTKPLPALSLANSDDLEVGDLVLAIGNPFGVGQTVTSGIVSALSRTGVGLSKLGSFIQTDAAINPGNSGGALIALDGKVVGINTAIFSKSGGSLGIGFAIPSNMVRAVLRSTSNDGKLVRPWLGASGQSVSQDIANSLGIERPAGVLISALHQKGAAAKAGLRVGDVILAINGHEIFQPGALAYRVATLAVGDSVTMRILRRRKTIALNIILSAAPETPIRDKTLLSGEQPLAGATVANMSPALAEELGTDPFANGIYVMKIKRGSPASRLGFRVGDFIRGVNGTETKLVKSLSEQLDLPAGSWRVSVMRGGNVRDLVINR
jgi:Do/DeqQ family serine protease